MEIILADEKATQNLAAQAIPCLTPPLVITLKGEIGAGKTTFVRALLQELGIDSAIKSPTYTLVESYQTPAYPIFHFDLYRLEDEQELEDMGFRDYFGEPAIIFIEWPERVPNMAIPVDVAITFEINVSGRLVRIESRTAAGKVFANCLMQGKGKK